MKFHHSSAALAALFLIHSSLPISSKPHQPAFTSLSPRRRHHVAASPSGLLSSSTIDELPSDAALDDAFNPESILTSRNRLLALSSSLARNSPTGRILYRPADKIKLQKAIQELEAMSNPMGENEKEMLVGDWTLVATANVVNSDIRRRSGKKEKERGWMLGANKRSGLSFIGKENRLGTVQETIRKSIEVTQRIRTDGGANNEQREINRVDNVIEYTPIDTLRDILPEGSPLSFLGDVNVNPFKVKKSKVVLVHKAEVESVAPVLRTKIAWVSSVVNVAGTSQFLDPEGADVIGTNNPLGEFLNVGTFDTPYVDQDMRISRTPGPVFEQLRVFVRKGSTILDSDIIGDLTVELRVEEEMEVSRRASRSEENVKKVTNAAKTVGDAMASIGEDVRSVVEKDLEGVYRAVGDAMDDVVGRVQDVVEEDLQEIGNAMEGMQKSFQGEGFEILDAVSNVTKAVTKIPQDVRKVVEEDVSTVGESVEDALDAMVRDVQDTVEEDLKKIDQSVKEVSGVISGEDDIDEENETGSDEKKNT